jgi:hypothetical protein
MADVVPFECGDLGINACLPDISRWISNRFDRRVDVITRSPGTAPGENEIAIALANNFFGSGLILRVADPEAAQLAAK